MSPITIRPAVAADVDAIVALVTELAVFEREPDAVVGTPQSYRQVMFPAHGDPTAWAFVAEAGGEVVGIAVWYLTFSTWTGRNGIWVEDLYVSPEHRGEGLATALLARVAKEAVDRGLPRVEWTCLDWNAPALRLYAHLGAEALADWTQQRLTSDALSHLADQAS